MPMTPHGSGMASVTLRLRVQMRSEIQQLQKRLFITTIYVTHDQEAAMAISGRIAVTNSRGIVQIARAEDLNDRPDTAKLAKTLSYTVIGASPAPVSISSVVTSNRSKLC